MIVEVDFTPDLLRKWEAILAEYRTTPFGESVATPELFEMERRNEERLRGATLRKLFRAMMDHQPAALDCAVIAAIDGMKAAHDKAREEGR